MPTAWGLSDTDEDKTTTAPQIKERHLLPVVSGSTGHWWATGQKQQQQQQRRRRHQGSQRETFFPDGFGVCLAPMGDRRTSATALTQKEWKRETSSPDGSGVGLPLMGDKPVQKNHKKTLIPGQSDRHLLKPVRGFVFH